MEFFNTHVSPESVRLVSEVLRSTWISEGETVRRFETALEKTLGLSNAVAVNSGTSALHLSLAVAGVGPEDEVIIPAQTFIATGYAVLMQGAVPVFADIKYETGNIDPDSIAEKISEKTKAVIPVHWGGYPCDMKEIGEIAAAHGVTVIEDAAHALGAAYNGRPVGTISEFTAFSFQAIKHLTTGDGGAVCCKRDGDYSELKKRRWFNIDREHDKTGFLGEREYDSGKIGFKYHMNNVAAAIGLGNLTSFEARLRKRRGIDTVYRRMLSSVPGLELLKREDDRESACWLFGVLVEKRDDFINKLRAAGVPVSVVHKRIDKNSIFGGMREDLVQQARLDEKIIHLPLHEGLSEEDVEKVVQTVRSGW
ncbi:MAG: DegT/DnrJ/EryC1/StrS family aminotransferase [Spirochaetes bacterium]|nr:DegT/DnrJ/EryC1/StrS family aminotransferase [Spirochaetota bacterium]